MAGQAQATSPVKALRVLLALEDAPQGRGLTEIARALDLPKSAVHRLLVTFQESGFVQQLPAGRRYVLGPILARLGLYAAERFALRVVARPYLEALAQEVGETVFLGVLAQDGVLLVDKVEHGQVLRIAPALGTMLPLRQTALGKLLLACCAPVEQQRLLDICSAAAAPSSTTPYHTGIRQELAAIARQGYALSVEEWIPDICCVAAPIRDGRDTVIAALAVALPRSRMPPLQRHDPFAVGGASVAYPTLVRPVLTAAEHISAALP